MIIIIMKKREKEERKNNNKMEKNNNKMGQNPKGTNGLSLKAHQVKENGEVDKYKARLVVKGYAQEYVMEACLWGFYGGWIFELQ